MGAIPYLNPLVLDIDRRLIMATYTTIREQIRERLDPVIEDIVSREVSERGTGGYQQRERGVYGQQQQQPFSAIAPILLSSLMAPQQQVGQQQQQHPLAQ